MTDRYIIELTDKKYRKFWEELLAQLDFVKVKQPDKSKSLKKTQKEAAFQDGLRRSIKAMQDDLSGKRPLPTLKDALNEL